MLRFVLLSHQKQDVLVVVSLSDSGSVSQAQFSLSTMASSQDDPGRRDKVSRTIPFPLSAAVTALASGCRHFLVYVAERFVS